MKIFLRKIFTMLLVVLFVAGFSNLSFTQTDTQTNESQASSQGEEELVGQTHPTPSMEGVRENPESASIKDNVILKGDRPDKAKIVFLDPIGDDKGPGYYTYPTHPVYVVGGFDIVKVEIDSMDDKNVTFKITVNADLKQDWGMAADFDIQFVQIYIDEDHLPGSGYLKSVPGLNIYFPPDQGWEKAILISPQPRSRVEIEVSSKAKDMEQDIVIPKVIKGVGRTIIAVVSKKDLDLKPNDDITKWGFQIFMQSNEGFPDPEDVLTRNVNEYRGLHRWGGGSDYWGDPEFADMIVWPAKGTLQEAKDQFEILNVWESYPDPTRDVKAVVPMVYLDQTEQWKPPMGYKKFAKVISEKLKPPAPKDKYVSDNFTFAGSVNAQWYPNFYDANPPIAKQASTFGGGGLNNTFVPEAHYDNGIYSRFTLEFYGKVFTDLLNFYARLETWWGSDSRWDVWTGNFNRDNHGPQYVPIDFQSFRFQFVKPLPTVDYISIGNYDVSVDAWTVGAASYPDRDKFKGIFVDGSSEFMSLSYHLGLFYPFPWLGLNWSLGNYTLKDHVLAGKVFLKPLQIIGINGFELFGSGYVYTDYELGSPNDNNAYDTIVRLANSAFDAQVRYNDILSGIVQYDVALKGGLAFVQKGVDPTTGQKLSDSGVGIPGGTNDLIGFFGLATLKVNNILDLGLNLTLQGFFISNYYSVMAARGDYANAKIQDVLEMYGNQSASPYPQDAAPFQKYGYAEGGNPAWESVSSGGWRGITGILEYSLDVLSLHGEFSYWGFNNSNYNVLPSGYTNGQLVIIGGTNTNKVDTIPFAMRGYSFVKYKLDVGNGLDIKLDYLFNYTKDWWPFAPEHLVRAGMTSAFEFTFGFTYTSHLPRLSLYYQFTKLFRGGIGFVYRYDIIHDLYPALDDYSRDYIVKGYHSFVDLQFSNPLGNLRIYLDGFIADNPRQIGYAIQGKRDFRVPLEYYGYKYNIVGLVELDIHF
ncbi:MAG: glucodextranase DOMON-like domain-containing protein [Brevinematia bacterium]